MRIAFVIYDSLDKVSGGYLYDRQLVGNWRAQGDTVDVVSLPWRSYGRHLLDNLSRPLVATLRDGRYDIIVQDELNHPSLFRLNRQLRQGPAPLACIVHHLRSSEEWPGRQRAFYRRIEQQYLASVDGFVFNSQTTARAVGDLLPHAKPSVVAYPGRDHIASQMTADRVRARAQEGPLRVLFVGNIIRRKGLHVLLEALARLTADPWTLTIVGDDTADPAYTAEIKGLIGRLPASGQVRWLGRLGDDALRAPFAAAHVLAVPSSYEGFGIAYMEALGFGLPAIATTAGAANEVIDDGVTGFLVAPDGVEQLADHLRELARNRRLLARMGEQALERFAKFPTWEDSAHRARRLLQDLVASKAAAL